MMGLKKRLYDLFVIIPNFPFIVAMAIFVLYKVKKETGLVEMQFISNDDLKLKGLEKFVNDVYPKRYRKLFAVIVWTTLVFLIIK